MKVWFKGKISYICTQLVMFHVTRTPLSGLFVDNSTVTADFVRKNTAASGQSQRDSFYSNSSLLSCTPSSAWKSHDVVPLIWPLHHAKYQQDRQHTFQGQKKTALLVFVSALSWKKKKESLTWLLVSIIFGCASYKIILIWQRVGKLLKVQTCFEDQTHTDGVIIIVQANQRLSIISVIQAQMRKTTVDQVVEGLQSECRGDLSVAAEMSNQTLLWASTTDQSQRNQA